MRYGILSDIHANLPALRAAVARLRREGVDRWMCAGDVVGYGPHPNECVELIADLDALCVAGNHERLLADGPDGGRAGGLAAEAIAWTRSILHDDCRRYLEGMPEVAVLPGLVLTHAALTDPGRYVKGDLEAAAELRRLAVEHPTARLLVVGHTHRQRVYGDRRGARAPARGAVPLPPPERFLVNPGSVGQSRQRETRPRARCMMLDTTRAQAIFYQEPYDVREVRAALRRHGLPSESIHIRPGVLTAGWRRVRRAAGRAPIPLRRAR